MHQSVLVQRGFSLIETVIATGLVVAAVVTLAQLVAMGASIGFSARSRTVSTLLAARKMEEIEGLAWSLLGAHAGDSAEYFDGHGVRVCGESQAPCPAATFVCHWSAEAAGFNAGVLFIEVNVARVGAPANSVTLITARSRKTL